MNMKKIAICLMAAGLLLTIQPLQLAAEPTIPNALVLTKPLNGITETDEMALIIRLDEIKSLDYSHMKFAEKRELRKEVRSIQTQLEQSGGVYISVGAAIIIILLLIIIF
jgi:hypothetical protein